MSRRLSLSNLRRSVRQPDLGARGGFVSSLPEPPRTSGKSGKSRLSLSSSIVPLRRSQAPLLLAAFIGVGGGSVSFPLEAEPPQSTITVQGRRPVTIGGEVPASGPCVSVDVAGHRAGTTDCAAEKLQRAARAAQQAATVDPALAVPNAHSPADKVGVATVNSAEQITRINLRGATSLPPRPTPPVPTSPFPRR